MGDGTEKPEFGEWSWLSPEEVIDRVSATSYLLIESGCLVIHYLCIFVTSPLHFYLQVVDFKKPVYKEVMAAFSPYLD